MKSKSAPAPTSARLFNLARIVPRFAEARLGILAAIAGAIGVAQAQTTNWTAAGTGNFATAINWSSGVPTSLLNTFITNGTTGTPSVVNLTTAGNVANLAVGANNTLNVTPAGSLAIFGTQFANAGAVNVNGGSGVNSFFYLANAVTFTGPGTTNLIKNAGGGDLYVRNSGGGSLINQSTIQGVAIFDSGMAINNQGTINANVSGQSLVFTSAPITNTGTLQATGGGVLRLNAGVTNNQGGTIASGASSTVEFATGATVQGGTLNSNGGTLGTVAGNYAYLDGTTHGPITIQGTYTGATGSSTYLDGTINNQGDLLIKGGGGPNAFLYVGSSGASTGATLNGGTVTLEKQAGGGDAYLRSGGGTGVLTNSATSTIQGAGIIDSGLTLVNQGTVNANISGQTLAINSIPVTNTGTIEATAGGVLRINSGITNNQGGTIASSASSTVEFAGAAVQGGTLNSNGGTLGTVAGNYAYLDGTTHGPITIQGTYTGATGSSTYLDGTINNQGDLLIKGGGGPNAFLYVGSSGASTGATLNGGTVTLEKQAGGGDAYLRSGGGTGVLTNSATSTIQGAGIIDSGLTLVNQGTVNANISGQTLAINSIPVTNTGTLEATGGGVLRINSGTTNNQGGTIASGASSIVEFATGATVQGGTLNSNGGALGTVANNYAYLDGTTHGPITLQGTYTGATNTSTYLDGTINNQGNLLIKGGAGPNAFLYVGSSIASTGATLNGGTVTLEKQAGGGDAYLRSGGGTGVLTNSATSTIQGAGIIDSGLTLVNQGTVNANVSGQTLAINGIPVTNAGTLEATGGGVLRFNSGTTNNQGGTIASSASSTVEFATGAKVQGGTLNSNGGTLGTVANNYAYLDGTTHGPITLQGTYTGATGSTTYLDGTINNQGDLRINAGGGPNTFLNIGNDGAGANFTGGGTVTLEKAAGGGDVYVRPVTAGQTLTNTDNTIQGAGIIDQGLTIVNGAAGTFLANSAGNTLLLNNTGTTTNNGTFQANAGSTLQVTSNLTNYAAGTLTGGTYVVNGAPGQTGTVQLGSLGNNAAGEIVNNAATIVLNGPTATTRLVDAGGNDALKPLANNTGSLTLNGGYGFTAVGNLDNSGTVHVGGTGSSLTISPANTYTQTAGLTKIDAGGTVTAGTAQISGGTVQLAGGTLAATTLNNAAPALIVGNGTINARPNNQGTVEASGGTLTVSNGIAGPTGTVKIDAGATLSLAGGASGSTTGTLTQNGTLALGSNNVTVSTSYTNANFGVGNSFDAHANVTGTGQINAAGNTGQAITGATVTNGTTATPQLGGFGNIRTGQTSSVTYNVVNTGSTGPSLIGAVQTNVNGGNITDARLSGTGVTAGNFGPLASGQSQSYTVTLNGTTAGAVAPGQTVHIANNFDNVADQTITLGGGAVYQAAQANTLPVTVNLGNVHVGANASTTLAISNVAPNTGGFTETLGATATGTTGAATTSGSVSGLAQGGTSNAITVGLNTATAGAISGTATLGFTSSEINGSGLGTIGVGSQTVNVTGAAYRLAQANLGTLAFGNVLVNSTQTRTLTVTNGAVNDGFSEGLNASFGSISGASAGLLSASGVINNLAAGLADGTQLQVTLNTSATGLITASVQVLLTSNGTGTSGLGLTALPTQNVAISGQITGLVGSLAGASAATPNPVNLGNVRVGAASPTQTLTLTNTAAGPAEGLNANFSGTSAGLTATGSFNGLAAGATNNSSLVVGLNTATAGLKNGTATISLNSDGTFNSGTPTSLTSQTIAVNGAVYQTAQASLLPANINLGTMRTGTVVNTTLSVGNIAPLTGGYTETLGAGFGPVGAGLSGSGAITGLAVGAGPSSALSVGFTAGSAGAFNGSATVNFSTEAINGSGLGTLGVGSQSVNFSATVNSIAQLQVLLTNGFNFTITGANSGELDFGTLPSGGGSLLATLNLLNNIFGPADSLLGSFNAAGLAGGPFSLIGGSAFNLAAGANQAFQLSIDANFGAGTYVATIVINDASHNAFQTDLALASFTLTLRGTINAPQTGGGGPTSAVPEPSTYGLLGALGLMAAIVARRRAARTR